MEINNLILLIILPEWIYLQYLRQLAHGVS